MTLPNHLIAKLRDQGLVVLDPGQEGAPGWLGRFTVSRGPWVEAGGVGVLPGPILWIYEEEGVWVAQTHEFIPGPGPTDFRHEHATAEEAVDVVLRFYRMEDDAQ